MASSPVEPPALAPYNVTLLPFSPIFDYGAIRDMDAAQGWNASYTNDIYTAAHDNELPAGIAYRRTQASARITFTFQGTGMYLCFSNGGANFTLTLDGGIWSTATSAENQPVCEHASGQADTLLYASGLRYGSHTVVLVVSATPKQEFRFFGGALEIGVQTGGKTVDDSLTVDDQDPQWKYTPERNTPDGWATSPTPVNRAHHLTATYTCLYDRSAYATYTFSGAGGAILSAVVWPDGHAVSVQLDDADPVNLSLTSIWWDGSVPFYIAGGLDPDKEHTITVRNFNSAVPNCDSERVLKLCCTSIDAIQILQAGKEDLNAPGLSQDPPQPPDVNGQPKPHSHKKSKTPFIAGGAVAATAAVILMVLTVFSIVRWRRRRRNEQSPFAAWPTSSEERPMRPKKALETGRSGLMAPHRATSGGHVVAAGSGAAVPTTAGGLADRTISPGLGAEDMERVLAFVAQRMDTGRRAPAGSGQDLEELPQYRG